MGEAVNTYEYAPSSRAQRVRAARVAILREAIAFVNDGNDADAVSLGFDPDDFNEARCEVASALIRMANRAEASLPSTNGAPS